MKILVLGSNGRLGKRLIPYLVSRGHEIYTHYREKDKYGNYLDYYISLERKIMNYNLDYVINLCALTDLDLCEKNINEAYK